MNKSNPFVPQGSLLEQQSKRRSRMKLGVLCVLVIGVAGLTAMLIQGCKREQNVEEASQPPVDTNAVAAVDTNPPPMVATNPPVTPPVVVAPPVVPSAAEYVVVKGDTLARIAKKNGVSVKALEAANPGVVPTKLKVGQKLTLPASSGGTTAMAPTADSASAGSSMGEEIYTVKSGDTLTLIAKTHGTTIKAIESANGLSTTKIKVGQKLKIPAKSEAAAPAPVPEPVPPPTATPAPAAAPSGQ